VAKLRRDLPLTDIVRRTAFASLVDRSQEGEALGAQQRQSLGIHGESMRHRWTNLATPLHASRSWEALKPTSWPSSSGDAAPSHIPVLAGAAGVGGRRRGIHSGGRGTA